MGDVATFMEEYERSYGPNHPTFHRGSYAQVNLFVFLAEFDDHLLSIRRLKWPRESYAFYWFVKLSMWLLCGIN